MSKTKIQSITTAAVEETPKPKFSPEVAQTNLKRIADSLRKSCGQLENIYQLTELDEQNPIIIGATYFMNEIRDRIAEDAEWVVKIADGLHVEGGAE